jgi:hypothetical protein
MTIRTIPLLGLLLALSTNAALITGVTIEDFTTEWTPGARPAEDCINGTGLSGGLHTTAAGDMWLSNGEETPVITFDLEGVYDLASFHVWNYNEGGAWPLRGANLVEILVAGSVGGAFTSLGDFTFAVATGANGYAGETIDLSAFPAIRLTANAVNGGAHTGAFVWREFDVFGKATAK